VIVRSQVTFSLATDFMDYKELLPAMYQSEALNTTLDQVVAWSAALAGVRIS
jgi:hypothetical protein